MSLQGFGRTTCSSSQLRVITTPANLRPFKMLHIAHICSAPSPQSFGLSKTRMKKGCFGNGAPEERMHVALNFSDESLWALAVVSQGLFF